jgi:hypothetical protein
MPVEVLSRHESYARGLQVPDIIHGESSPMIAAIPLARGLAVGLEHLNLDCPGFGTDAEQVRLSDSSIPSAVSKFDDSALANSSNDLRLNWHGSSLRLWLAIPRFPDHTSDGSGMK